MAPAIERIVVINDDSVESGGAAGIALASIRELRRRDVPVTLLTGDSGSNPDLAGLGVDVESLEGQHILEGSRAGAALRGLYSPRTAALLKAWIDTHDTPGTVYHLHNWHKVLSPSAFMALRRIASRLVISMHDYFVCCPNGAFYHFPQGKVCDLIPMGAACIAAQCDKRSYTHKLWRVARTGVRQAAFGLGNTPATVLAVHEGMRPLMERGGISRSAIRVLRNPVSPWLNARVKAERNRTFLFVGRLEEDKGVKVLARAAQRANAKVRIIGTGPLAAELARDFPQIEMSGWRTKAEIAELCRDARALVMPSRWRETFGLAAIEAAMSGIPVLASRAALITEDLVRLGIGVGYPADDVEALAQALTENLRDDGAIAAMSHCGFENARLLAPTAEAWGDELISIYAGKLAAASLPRASPR
ncbi:MAG TPA: glycosyltransferase family 4 protein, partial [Hyphomicrobium sp.]